MNLPDDVVADYTGGNVAELPLAMRAPTLYTRRLTHAEKRTLHHFDFEVRW